MKKRKGECLISCIIILLPILVGLLLWQRLPEQMPTHWGFDGEVNGWSSRPFAVFAMPLFIFAAHIFCFFATAKDSKNQEQNNKLFHLVIWICPVVSILLSGMMYAAALGKEFDANVVMFPLLGLMFAILGNYLPKCRQNQTIGIRVKWTLEDEANWNATHRISGKIWVLGGLFMIVFTFLPETIALWAMVILLTVLTLLPLCYSYFYYKKHSTNI